MRDCIFIIFGSSVDLFKRKLFPSLYMLIAQKRIERYAIVGAAMDDVDIRLLIERSKPFIKAKVDNELIEDIIKHAYYHRLNFDKIEDFNALGQEILTIEKRWKLSGNRIFYCAASSDFFCQITKNIAQSGLAIRKEKNEAPWHRVVYEKPFGNNVDSAKEINNCIEQYFNEVQIYRIDHYLTKEIVGNIALVRFTNCVFEPLWNNRYVDNVQITLSEKIGIENRGAYYDRYGAISDVLQNHMLELLGLIAMEAPYMLTGEHVREQRAAVLKNVEAVDGILGQYEGYATEPFVQKESKIETFAAIMLRINNRRWSGVPFYLKTGKYLNKKETLITIKFKQVDCLLKVCPRDSNYLTIRIDPDASFRLHLNVKKPGLSQEVIPIGMDFCHSCLFESIPPEAYEILLEDIMRGEHSVSVRFDEIEYAWRIIEEIKKLDMPLYSYKKGSVGPKELEEFNKKHGLRWLV